ncbi:MAG: phage capsid protein [Lachnospiraceae bacterium]|nr:phage capsid protein [Lachnospiraceae bacterium]
MITLEQAKVGREDKVDQQVIDCFRRSSLLLDKLVFDDALVPGGAGSTLTYGYQRVKTPSTAAFREINKEYEPQEQTKEKHEVEVKVFGGAYEIDRVIEGTSGKASEVAQQTEAKVKAACCLFQKTVIDGDSASDKKSFDGLDKALRGTNTEINAGSYIDISTAALLDQNYKTLLDLLDEFLASLSGRPDCIMANTSMLTKLKAAARRAGYLTHSEDSFGRSVDSYDGIPFMDMGYYAKKNDNGTYTEMPCVPIQARTIGTDEVTGLTDIYAPVINITGFHGVTVKGKKFVSQYLPDFKTPGAVKKGEVEMLAACALKNSRAAAVLRNIKIK